MTVVQISNNQLIGVAADTKPTTYPAGTCFFETDTGSQFYYNGTTWTAMGGGGGSTPNRSQGYYFIKGTNATMQNRRYTPSITSGPNAASTTSPAANTLFALPFVVSRSTQFDLISFRVTTLGSGNARAGIYYDTGNTYPGVLMFDTGSISTTAGSTSAARDTTITSGLQTFAPGLYWLAWETDSATGQYNVYNGAVLQSSAILGNDGGMGASAPAYGYSVAHTFGALPDPYTASAAFLSTAPALGNPIVTVGLRPI